MDSSHLHEEVEQTILEYIKSRIPHKGTACLAGNSVHADKMFLDVHMPSITDWLHYRYGPKLVSGGESLTLCTL